MEVDWPQLVDPKEAAICFDVLTLYYDPKKGAKTGPDIVRTPDYVKDNFKKTTVYIKTNIDLKPLNLQVCGEERKKVIVFELKIGHQKKQQRLLLKAIPACPKSNSGWKFEPFVYVILCSLILVFPD